MRDTVLSAAVGAIAPVGTAAAGGPISGIAGALWPEEEAAIRGAVSKRHTEFVAGRSCARAALEALGCANQAIPMAPSREPVWPNGFAGSISHSATHCIAVAVNETVQRGIGCDLEPNTPMDPGMRHLILCPEEMRRSDPLLFNGQLAIDFAKLVFAAKEAAFKAHFPLTRRFLDFQDAKVVLNTGASDQLLVEIHAQGWGGPSALKGRWSVEEGHIIVCAWL